ncbi:MAG: UDP-3-O-(3-hydroxymyristoyl)glucosamine N-acyltransferase [Xanthobacteraceae bacterium]|nr:UDP-3-O-(3-hydroxymyristoyl)glucosamine N-acyltransferase [Xanthobacteraceae bacterium]
MTAQSFFKEPEGLTVGEIAALTGAKPREGAKLDRTIRGIATLDRARASDLAFFESAKYLDQLAATRAAVCLTTERFAERVPQAITVLLTKEPFRDFVIVARKLYPDSLKPRSMFGTEVTAPGAHVHETAEIEDGVTIDPGAVIGPRAGIGSGTVIGPNAVIGPDVQIGRDCSVGPGASIMHALIGDNVILHAGCRIGQDGFRYQPSAEGHIKVPQLGRVIVQDSVEIGANTTIDRGGSGDTVIGEGTKIDNLVQIGHNCMIGRHCIIVSECGLSGSVVLGDHVILGGQVGIADHLTVGEGAVVGAKSGVVSNIPPGERWLGFPAMPGREFLRVTAALRKRI